jgi:hypothetical protein
MQQDMQVQLVEMVEPRELVVLVEHLHLVQLAVRAVDRYLLHRQAVLHTQVDLLVFIELLLDRVI